MVRILLFLLMQTDYSLRIKGSTHTETQSTQQPLVMTSIEWCDG